jgi:hypothetical protein
VADFYAAPLAGNRAAIDTFGLTTDESGLLAVRTMLFEESNQVLNLLLVLEAGIDHLGTEMPSTKCKVSNHSSSARSFDLSMNVGTCT